MQTGINVTPAYGAEGDAAAAQLFEGNENDIEDNVASRRDIASRIATRTMDNVSKFVRGVPMQLKNNPLAVLGVGIGVGIAIGAVVSPLRGLFVGSRGVKGLKGYRKQLVRALGI